ncbi:MAG: ABC-2 type transport system permease protein [Myxococcota bacterium]|jgi:ABC-2 type transport system permease protein
MNALTVARKELRALFQSPVALIFLAIFLVTTLVGFFTTKQFFARGLADVRPLFELLPLLLIFLVAAITMRSWAEEKRAGTLEVLLTLPVSTIDLVLGKFLAGMALVGIALALTFPLPFVVSVLGPLDWGPVVGGYLGAMLLGSAYMAIGLCISARTDNQVVALMSTLVVGGVAYLIGDDRFTTFFTADNAEFLRALGTGSRFESIGRGVIDLRDLAYYGSVTAFFLVLNGYFLEALRIDPGSDHGKKRTFQLGLLIGLTLTNAVALGAWLYPVSTARIDITENGDFSISPTTEATLAALDEPLRIRGFFSARTHALLEPLIPQIRDLLTEYEVRGKGKVVVEFADPNADETLEAEINEQYGIRSFPFGVSDRTSQGVVNAYFHVLIQYGDEYDVLDFQELIEVQADDSDIQVELRNLEYDVTRTIKKVTQDFQSLDVILSSLPGQAKLTAYITPTRVPEDYQGAVEAFRNIGADVADRSRGKLVYSEVDPSTDEALMDKLYTDYGVQPLAVDLFGQEVFYLHLVLELGDTVQRILPRGDISEAELRQAIESAVKRGTPGQLKKVGIATLQPVPPPPNPNLPPQLQPPPPRPDYGQIQRLFQEFYEVEVLDLADGYVPEDVDVLVVGKTGPMSELQKFAVDQFLMRGGSVVALAGGRDISIGQFGLEAAPAGAGLNDLLATYGVTVADGLVMDPQNAMFPFPKVERRGGFQVQRVELLPYPMFPDIRPDGFDRDHPALAGLSAVSLPWASPLALAESLPEGVTAQELLHTSAGSWVANITSIEPDFVAYPDYGFARGDAPGRQLVGLTLEGRFPSHYADKTNPLFGDSSNDGSGRTIKSSVADGRLVVLGSGEVVSDVVLSLASQQTGMVHRGNLQLVQNLIDWSVEDTDLLAIRSGGAFTRTLLPLSEAAKVQVEFGVYALVMFPMLLVVLLPMFRSRSAIPIPLPKEAE